MAIKSGALTRASVSVSVDMFVRANIHANGTMTNAARRIIVSVFFYDNLKIIHRRLLIIESNKSIFINVIK